MLASCARGVARRVSGSSGNGVDTVSRVGDGATPSRSRDR